MKLTEQDAIRGMLRLIRENETKNSSPLIDASEEEYGVMRDALITRTKQSNIKIVSFKVYPENRGAIIVAEFPELNSATVQFDSTKDDGIYINSANVQLNTKNIGIMSSLPGFQEFFIKEWSTKFDDEYRV